MWHTDSLLTLANDKSQTDLTTLQALRSRCPKFIISYSYCIFISVLIMAYSCFYEHDSLKQPYSATLNYPVCWHVARSTRKLRSCCARNSLRRRPDLFCHCNGKLQRGNPKLQLPKTHCTTFEGPIGCFTQMFLRFHSENHNSFLGFLTLSILKFSQMFVQHLNLLRALLLRRLQALPRVDAKQQHPNMS